ncbi:MAG TPA: cation-translocating P-type ATPase [Candidatus Binatia bacterium]
MQLTSKDPGEANQVMEPMGVPGAHALTAPRLAEALRTDINSGLTHSEASRRLVTQGPNALKEEKQFTLWGVIAGQFASFLIVILIVAGATSFALGEAGDAALIFAIVILNAFLGAYQELRAEKALEALMHAVSPTARVIREGVMREIPAAELVSGDLTVLQAGDLVPADVRLVEAHSLSLDESPLTGESMPVNKSPEGQLDEKTALADRSNCVHMGTRISYGRGRGIVFATGMGTQLGQIATMVTSQSRAQTPLQRRLSELGKWLGGGVLGLCTLLFAIGLFRGVGTFEMFLVAVSLAVAAVPEGLPAVVTIALALGLQRMLKRHALVRRLAAVETLGAATVICTDKTGTLTRGAMEVERLYLAGENYHIRGNSLEGEGKAMPVREGTPLHTMLLGMALCNDAALQELGERGNGRPVLVGSPTEVALARAATALGLPEKSALDREYPRIAENPFDSLRKRMATAHRKPDGRTLVFAKGAPDVVAPLCTRVVVPEGIRELDGMAREQIARVAEDLASQAYRLLAVAFREDRETGSHPAALQLERDLTFIGLAGLMDPPREETSGAVAECSRAGIRTIMVTGDHGKTAVAIARSVGMLNGEPHFLTGSQVDDMSQEELRDALGVTRVFSRVSPHHKLRIVEALQDQGQIVAMTGDGSNDAPALKKADIGVAMGIRGTDVSKEAADMVLTDDNFQSIVAAVHEGRVIYSNIRKVVMYLLSCNIGEILAVFAAMVSGYPLLLEPVQILWLNLVTDGLPALALSVEKEEPGIMAQPPRNPKEGILTGRSAILLTSQGIIIAAVTLAGFILSLALSPQDVRRAQTVAFVTLTLSELCRAYAFRVELVSVFTQGLFSNPSMVWASLVSAALLFAVVYVPALQVWFDTVALGLTQWWYVAPLILVPFTVAEVTRALARKRSRNTN